MKKKNDLLRGNTEKLRIILYLFPHMERFLLN